MKKIVNPFNYLPLRQALCWGVVAMILTAVFMWQLGLRATSLTQIDFGGSALWKVTVFAAFATSATVTARICSV